MLSEYLFFLVSRYLHSQLCTDSGLCYCLLQMDNHHPFFPTLFTTIWDTTCIRVEDSGDWALGRYTNNGHYDFPCYLVLLGITFTGLLVFYSGLHRSTAYDSHIFNDTAHLHPQHPCEMKICDGHFSPSLETRNSLATLRSKRISDFRSGGGTADHLTGSLLTN